MTLRTEIDDSYRARIINSHPAREGVFQFAVADAAGDVLDVIGAIVGMPRKRWDDDCPYHVRLHPDEKCTCAAASPQAPADTVAPAAAVSVPMLLYCPECCERHVDEGEFATKVHHTHACQSCGLTWRPAIVATVGVRYLPGFKDEDRSACPRCGSLLNSDRECLADVTVRKFVESLPPTMETDESYRRRIIASYPHPFPFSLEASSGCGLDVIGASIGVPRDPATPASAPATPQIDPGACSCCGAPANAPAFECATIHAEGACPKCDAAPPAQMACRRAAVDGSLSTDWCGVHNRSVWVCSGASKCDAPHAPAPDSRMADAFAEVHPKGIPIDTWPPRPDREKCYCGRGEMERDGQRCLWRCTYDNRHEITDEQVDWVLSMAPAAFRALVDGIGAVLSGDTGSGR